MPSRVPNILVIDDEPNESLLLPLDTYGHAKIATRHPREVEEEDLLSADLILVDYQLDHWPERDRATEICLRPKDGLALAALLRRHAQRSDDLSPAAFAIYTGQISAVASPLPPENRLHALSALTNLEWVFSKGTPGDTHTIEQIRILAEAVTQLPQRWTSGEAPGENALTELGGLLGVIGTDELSARLLLEVEQALPPIHEVSQWSHGLAVLRWLLHRVLPYPCFLWPTAHLSARFRIEWPVLQEALNDEAPLRSALSAVEYKGILSGFLGLRWWRTGVELWLWEHLGNRASDDEAVYDFICSIAEKELSRSRPGLRPIVCLNRDFEPSLRFSSIEEAVRIRPDGWPAYAEQAWTTVEAAMAEPRLRSLVLVEERERLD
jgi:hypothetical protein